jgi:hypothetical protein
MVQGQPKKNIYKWKKEKQETERSLQIRPQQVHHYYQHN